MLLLRKEGARQLWVEVVLRCHLLELRWNRGRGRLCNFSLPRFLGPPEILGGQEWWPGRLEPKWSVSCGGGGKLSRDGLREIVGRARASVVKGRARVQVCVASTLECLIAAKEIGGDERLPLLLVDKLGLCGRDVYDAATFHATAAAAAATAR